MPDFTRDIFDPRKQYTSVRLQQGRVLTDADWNENERIGVEDERRSRVEIIGPAGSPDTGFHVANPRIDGGRINFDLEAGSFYLGGHRLELPAPQAFRAQGDDLQSPADRHPAPAGARHDLVYLVTYQAPVTAVEDGELLEVGLGGPDTTSRERQVQRAVLVEDVGTDSCEEAWQALLAAWEAQGRGTLGDDNQLVTDARLTVGYGSGGDAGDLCTPAAAGGYLGAENQAIRVQLVDRDHLTWGFDNASPLYRVQLDAGRQTVTLLTEPKDEAHWMLAGQTVEILPWAAVLPNAEKTAELRGHLARLSASYDPDTREVTLDTAVPAAGFDDWQLRPDAAALGADGEYYYMRVWDRGSDQATPAAIPFTPGTAVTLGQTGIEVTISGSERRAGDFWLIAARPETPTQVSPWSLEDGRPPHGVRRFYAPLALIHWQADGTATTTDCRPRFRPLTRQAGCCTYQVGDGVRSHGHFDSIEEALRHLPDAGGEICLLPGRHRANALLRERQNIKIAGCGEETFVLPRAGAGDRPIFEIVDSQGIELLDMNLVTVEGSAVVARGTEPDRLLRLEVAHNRILARQNGVHVLQGQDVSIHHNTIRMLDVDGGDVAIYLLGEGALIERNEIGVVPPEATPPGREEPDDGEERPDPTDPCAEPEEFYANFVYLIAYVRFIWSALLLALLPRNPYRTLGGIQIGSGSERVRIVENRIVGGAGNGITLGSDLDPADLPGTGQPPPEQEEHRIDVNRNAIWGGVFEGDRPLARTTVVFETRGRTLTAVTDEDGLFLTKAVPGDYRVRLADERYRIVEIERQEQGEFGTFFRIAVEAVEAEQDLLDVLAFIYEVIIDDNEIVRMGESGIGMPHIDLEELAERVGDLRGLPPLYLGLLVLQGFLNGFLVDLTIRQNQIQSCLGNVFPLDQEDTARERRGVGGISLGLCERLVIQHNRIEENGRAYRGPAHGIYVFYVSEGEIGDNWVRDNGPDGPRRVQVGHTGGIAVTLATVLGSDFGEVEGGDDVSRAAEVPFEAQALRVHDNLVRQPLGRALTAMALGPMSVADNQFTAQLARVDVPGQGQTPGLAPSVLATLMNAAQNAGAVFVADLGQMAVWQQFQRQREGGPLTLPTGQLLFNDNQVRLSDAGQALVSVALVSMDDVVCAGNQLDVLVGDALVVNSLLIAPTLRAGHNRLQEPALPRIQGTRLALWSLSAFMNNTIHNQGNYCIVVTNLTGAARRVDTGNLALLVSPEQCRSLEDLLGGNLAGRRTGSYLYRAVDMQRRSG